MMLNNKKTAIHIVQVSSDIANHIRVLIVSVLGAVPHDNGAFVVDVDDAVIGVATPIWRPDAGAIGTTRDMTGSLEKGKTNF